MDLIEDVLINLRRVIRATDLYSRRLSKESGLTAPQLLVITSIEKHPEFTISEIAKDISLSQATVTTIVDRLESRQLVTRVRSEIDRRRIHPQLTKAGRQLIESAPTPLQDNFIHQFQELEGWEQLYIVAALKRVASMMDAEKIDAAPLLHLGDINSATANSENRQDNSSAND